MGRSPNFNPEENMIEHVIARPYLAPVFTAVVIGAGILLAFW
jgi:hypothetical protein